MPSIPHPYIICGLSPRRLFKSSVDNLQGDPEQTCCAVRSAAESIHQSERLEIASLEILDH
ncbi:hypothetical protein GGE48_006603 [Rhizobium leguminosarum]|nr:hypothetical protein [Rhizobium leguminosarum]